MVSLPPSSLAYPSPSPSSETASLADSEYVLANEWPSATSSRVCSPLAQSSTMSSHPPEPAVEYPKSSKAPPTPATPSPPETSPSDENARWMPPSEIPCLPPKATKPDYVSSRKKHVPRPPNAFMLFRSTMINTQIPKIENRQQNVSRIAGEIWNKLDDEVKQAWHAKAEEAQRQHKLKYPDYKFTPSRKAAQKGMEGDGAGRTLEDHIRHLREKYMGVMGPAVAPTRKRKVKSSKVKHDEDEDYAPPLKSIRARLATFEPLSPPPRPRPFPPTPLPPTSSNLPVTPAAPATVPLPPWRLPQPYSTSNPSAYDYLLLADECVKLASSAYPTVSAPHESSTLDRVDSRRKHIPYFDFDRTPTAASFGSISPPSMYAPAAGAYGTFQHNILGLADLALPHSGYYPSYYSDAQVFLATQPAPSPPQSQISVPELNQFTFPDDMFTNLPGSSTAAPQLQKIAIPAPPLVSLGVTRDATPETSNETSTSS